MSLTSKTDLTEAKAPETTSFGDPSERWSRSSLAAALPALSQPASEFEAQRYQTRSKLGEGGMGVVLEATDLDLTRNVALKTLKASLASDPEAVLRFVREAQTIGKLEHPGIPAVHEVGVSHDGRPFFAMRLVRGQTLAEIIELLKNVDPATHRKYSFTVRAQIIQSLCDAVHFAAEKGIVHRDIKPENIMVGPFGELQLMDWGASYDKNQTGPVPVEPDFLGTVNYAAPERFSDPKAALDPTSEIWSLGLVMYELFTLRPVFEQRPMGELLQQVLTRQIPPPESIRNPIQGRCPKDFADIIRRATSRKIAMRYQSALEMRNALQMSLQSEPPVVCACTGFKRGVGILDRVVDNGGGVVVFLMALWAILPFLLVAWILFAH